MKSLLSAIFVVCFSLPSIALETGSQIPETALETQFGEPIKITSTTRWIIFASDKASSKLGTESLQKATVDLEKSKMIYVSDISQMPSLITKMVALPKMRKYDFKMALDKSGEVTKAWPRQEGKLTTLELSELKVSKIGYLGTAEEVATFFKGAAKN